MQSNRMVLTMKRFTMTVEYGFNAEHKGSKYFYNGRYMNRGELIETAIAHKAFGLSHHRKDTVPFNVKADIEFNNIGYSVKSYESSLCDIITTKRNDDDGKQYIINGFLEESVADMYIYGVLHNEMIEYFIMSKDEFAEFLRLWKLDSPDGNGIYKLRAKRNQKAFKQWFADKGTVLI